VSKKKRDEALVANGADEAQVANAARIEGELDKLADLDFDWILRAPQGRRFIWRLLKQTRVFESIFVTNATIYYNAGQQDIGHFVFGELMRIRPQAYLEMVAELQSLVNNPPQKEEDDNG
jgi:hypothetical protein